jgi:hypothetical protein
MPHNLLLARAALLTVAGVVGSSATACGSSSVSCAISCAAPPGGCHYEGARTEGNCSDVTCGRVVCPGVDGGGSSITLGDGTALHGDAIRVDIFDGNSPFVQINLAGSSSTMPIDPGINWTLFAEFDTATFKAGTLVASINNQAPAGPGIAMVQRRDANASTAASSGTVNLTKDSTGLWTGTVATDQGSTSATVRSAAVITCLVPADQLGATPNSPPGSSGVTLKPDTQFQTTFCSQFK